MKRTNGHEEPSSEGRVPPSPTPAPKPRLRAAGRAFSSFRNRNYRLFWFGQLLSLTGTWISRIAQAWLVLSLTDSSFALGLVSALQFAPMTLFSLFGGVLADRLPKRKVLIFTQSVMATQAITLALLVSTGQVQVWHIYALAFVLGSAASLDNPTRQAFLIEMVGREDLPNAIALNSSLFNMARIVGPAIGGALIAAFDVSVPFYLNALSYLAVIGGLFLMRPEQFHNVPIPARGPIFARMREGIQYASRTPDVALILIMIAFIGTFGFNFTVTLPLIARYVLDTGPLGFGSLMTALGAGALVSSLGMAYTSRPTERLLLFGAASFTLLLGLLAISTSLVLTLSILFFTGISNIIFTATANSRLQLFAPGELRGRVMSLYIFLNNGTGPLGALSIGLLAERYSVEVAMVTTALLCGTGLALGLFYLSRNSTNRGAAPDAATKTLPGD